MGVRQKNLALPLEWIKTDITTLLYGTHSHPHTHNFHNNV